jgi:hypothetical protein
VERGSEETAGEGNDGGEGRNKGEADGRGGGEPWLVGSRWTSSETQDNTTQEIRGEQDRGDGRAQEG